MTYENQEDKIKLYSCIGKLITSSLDPVEIIEGIMAEIKTFFNPQNWSLMRLDPTTDSLFFSAVHGIDPDELKEVRMRLGEGIAGMVAKTGELIFVPDTSIDKRFSNKVDKLLNFKTRSIIAVPLKFQDRVYGVIEIVNWEKGALFTEDDVVTLQTIADFSAIALANSIIYEEALALSQRDPLTGVNNQAMLNEVIMEWKANPGRRGDDRNNVKVVFIDLNNFKEINDEFGHREGDRVLKSISSMLKSRLRQGDQLFRVGGDEFLILIRVKRDEVSEELQQRIEEELSIMSVSSKKRGYNVSFSFGISYGKLHEIENLIHEADKNMYKQKEKIKGG